MPSTNRADSSDGAESLNVRLTEGSRGRVSTVRVSRSPSPLRWAWR